MVRELVTIQVGQCGNQIGRQFWQLAVEEHSEEETSESRSSFFQVRRDGQWKARALLVDMEEGPVAETRNGPLGGLFDDTHFLTDVSGSGNNWAHGYGVYGPQYEEQLLDKVQTAAELCDSLQSFFCIHSLGGGTGSGLGTYILALLEDHYPDVYRFTTAIFPSADDDVITSPYNSLLALRQLTDHADCVLPLENEALFNMCAKMNTDSNQHQKNKPIAGSKLSDGISNTSTLNQLSSQDKTVALGIQQKAIQKRFSKNGGSAFAEMNNVVARLLTNLTSSMRFEGSLNVDLNEITTNLVPFPKLHYLMSSMSPMFVTSDHRLQVRRLNQAFSDVFHKEFQLINANPRAGLLLACGLLVRGNVEVSDINSNIRRIQNEMQMIYWNKEGFKVGLCSVPPVKQPYSLLSLSNNSVIRETFKKMRSRFFKLYKRKAHLHHYTEYIEASLFDEAVESVDYIISEYQRLENSTMPPLDKIVNRKYKLAPVF